MRRSRSYEKEGYIFGGLFGLSLQETTTVVNKLLKPHKLKLQRRSNGDDQSWVRLTDDKPAYAREEKRIAKRHAAIEKHRGKTA